MGGLQTTSTSCSSVAQNFNTSYTYDKAPNRTGFIDPESGSTTCAYDTLNRLQTPTPPAAISGGNFGFGYDALNRRTKINLLVIESPDCRLRKFSGLNSFFGGLFHHPVAGLLQQG
jgi:YD repeat-containing protein